MKFTKLHKVLALVVALVVTTTGIAAFASNSGDGYTEVSTVQGLKDISKNLSGKYRLVADIDLSAASWDPIGGYAKVFKGELDGDGYTISGLWSASNLKGYKGLFSVLEGANIYDLNIEVDERGLTAIYEVGALAGVTQKGTKVTDVNVSGGKIVVTGGGYAGGLVGISRGSAYGGDPDEFTNITVTGTTTKTSGNYSGGLFGVLDGESVVKNAQTIDTASTGVSYVGGLVGAAKGGSLIQDSSAKGTASGSAAYVGGLVGVLYEESTINNSEAYVDVTTKTSYAGGIAGAVYGKSSVQKAFAYGDVTAKHYAGGLIGTLYGHSVLEQSGAAGNVSLTGGYIAGGLVGEVSNGTISNTYALGNVSGGTGSATGVGGLVGYFSGVGTNSVTNSFSAGTVAGKGTTELGAFSGLSAVTFIGANYFDSDNSGVQAATGSSKKWKGETGAYPQGKGTDELLLLATFEGWDFDNIWSIDEGTGYPYIALDVDDVATPEPSGTPDPDSTPADLTLAGADAVVNLDGPTTSIIFPLAVAPADLAILSVEVAFTDIDGIAIDSADLGYNDDAEAVYIDDGAYEVVVNLPSDIVAAWVADNGPITVTVHVVADNNGNELAAEISGAINLPAATPSGAPSPEPTPEATPEPSAVPTATVTPAPTATPTPISSGGSIIIKGN
ncbi:MAG: hypothetical protein LBC41_08185 [Clostridiales bacterium]|nr:hypothetical protein [Clostridiales bacterium]